MERLATEELEELAMLFLLWRAVQDCADRRAWLNLQQAREKMR